MSISIAPAPAEQVAGSRPAWRSLLEARWQQRLITLTELSLAYHDAAERADGGYSPAVQAVAATPQVRRLLREATAARCALRDTEEALARLSDGSYGQCEQCSAPIPVAELLAEPEARYCAECVRALP
jgi:RNA polymerase-binding transcription factor DksA